MVNKNKKIISFGGWYQRTTLHLSELWDFFSSITSKLKLSKEELKKLHKNLGIKKVSRKTAYLEYIEILTNSGIKIRYYEDGLYRLSIESEKIEESKLKIKEYFYKKFSPAVEYLFSLGAPTPKILANITEEHPIVIGISTMGIRSFKLDEKIYGRVYSETSSGNTRVFKTPEYIILVTSAVESTLIDLIEMQIFFREFKTQLHKYLNIHRNIWEKIDEIKEKGEIKGKDVAEFRSKLENYKKTIIIIRSRINQMNVYADTRSSIATKLRIKSDLATLFEYRFEDLFSSLKYIKEIWELTVDYVNSGIEVLGEISSQMETSGIESIRILASIGVVTGVLGYMSEGALPIITKGGALYLVGIGLLALSVNFIMDKMAKMKKYELSFTEIEKISD